jgi:hypothetical protein
LLVSSREVFRRDDAAIFHCNEVAPILPVTGGVMRLSLTSVRNLLAETPIAAAASISPKRT